jgi:hypothetical protein
MDAIDAIFGRFYSVPIPDRKRTQPLQVICIGHSRAGTVRISLSWPREFLAHHV